MPQRHQDLLAAGRYTQRSLRAVTPSALGALARDLTEADERGGGTETVFSAWAAVSEDT